MQSGIPEQIGNYDVERRLGNGSMGTVYLARDRELGRHVAIKVIQANVDSPDMRERFNREARSIAALNHPSIVTLYHSGLEESLPYLVLEYIDGRSVLDVIANRDPVPPPRRLLWIEQLCEGLHYAHERSIIHRDIKPANLMIDHLDRLRILDFGIARIFGESRTAMSTLIGTPAYMAPEYIRGEGIDARADVFAAGAVAYELLSYQRAFSGDTYSTILHRVLSEMPPPFVEAGTTSLDPELEQIVFRALSKDPASRFQSAREFAAAIRTVRTRIELNAPTWSGTADVTMAIDGRHTTTTPSSSGPGVVPGGGAAVPDQAGFAPTQVVDSRTTASLRLGTPDVAQDEPSASYDSTVLSDPRRTSTLVTDAPPDEPSRETRAASSPRSNTRLYIAIAACVLIIPAALFTWLAYFDKPAIDTSGSTSTTVGVPSPTDPPVPVPVPDPSGDVNTRTGPVDAGKVAGGGSGNVTTPTGGVGPSGGKVDAGTKTGGIGPAVPDSGDKPIDPIDVGPVRTAYELFNASNGPTLPGLIYRILQRANGGNSVASVDPRDTVFRTGRDQFRFAFRSNIDGYLYVAQKSDQGDWDVVFPEPGVNGGSNRVQKNQDYVAPSPDWFQLDPPSGTERVFVFLSKTPVSAFTDLNRPVTSQATLAQAEIDKLTSTISMRKLVVAKGEVPSAASGTGGSGVYVVNADAFADAVMVTFDMTHK